MSKLTAVGLFSGIGGMELGLSRSGHTSTLLVENDASANAVLKSRFPNIPKHEDVRTLKSLPSGVDLVCAGFPCQDLSQAGTTKGIEGSRSGLVNEVFRLIRKAKTPWVLLENVPFMLHLNRGKALDFITSSFENMGYNWAYRVVDTRAFGLPQRRRRVYFLASRVADPRTILLVDHKPAPLDGERTNDIACGFYWTEGIRGLGWAVDSVPTIKGGSGLGIPSPPAIWFPDDAFGTPDIKDAERLQGFRANWTLPAERESRASSRWKLVGNAVSVPALQWIGNRLDRPGEFFGDGIRPLDGVHSWPNCAWNIGEGRFTSANSEYPKSKRAAPLFHFLKFPWKPLSVKATSGFLNRVEKSSLRFPPGFIHALRAYLLRRTVEEC